MPEEKMLESFISEQRQTNKDTKAILSKLTDAFSILSVTVSKVSTLEAEQLRLRDSNETLTQRVASTTELVIDFRTMKRWLLVAALVSVSGGGYILDRQAEKDDTELKEVLSVMKAQAVATEKIAANLSKDKGEK